MNIPENREDVTCGYVTVHTPEQHRVCGPLRKNIGYDKQVLRSMNSSEYRYNAIRVRVNGFYCVMNRHLTQRIS